MNSQIKLKPCPFCGSPGILNEDIRHEKYISYYVKCESEKCFYDIAFIGSGKMTEAGKICKELADKWNERYE